MHKIRLAWRILTGKAHVLEVSEETYGEAIDAVKDFRTTMDGMISTAVYLYREDTEPYIDKIVQESELAEQVREVFRESSGQ
ncbi:hypothetical protein SEA_KELA_158 [Streptomyces phage Kela]|jgi:hypothetical protein|nr:hypothetical protein SEA_JUSTBECAUSE_160 [Streptomyces phage JustBecause]QJD53728.1 hypothetical protein SEA_KELA_158 [Streptomyces phage Kela]